MPEPQNCLVVYYSFTGNNRLLAEHLAARLGCDHRPVVEAKPRREITILWDLLLRRRPRIEPLGARLADYDHVVLVAPVWDARIASPLKSLLRREAKPLPEYSFITLCGYDRPGQRERLFKELRRLAGHAPKALTELEVAELFPLEEQERIRAISAYRAKVDDLPNFETQIEEFITAIQEGA